MEHVAIEKNRENLQLSCEWLRKALSDCLAARLRGDSVVKELAPFQFYRNDSGIALFLDSFQPTQEEYLVVMLALMPHIVPDFFDEIIAQNLLEGGELPEFGGVRSGNHRGILPTGETAQFVLAGRDLGLRLAVQRMLGSEHWFSKKRILWLEGAGEGEPAMSGRLVLDREVVEQLTVGTVSRPRFSMEFPAQYVETEMEWDDLVLHPDTRRQIREMENWIAHSDTVLHAWGMKKKVKPGYRALFYGPPGTGKTLAAALLGKSTGREVYRIDLSRVVSKYIGETERNLASLFDRAENKEWILFFDEADALFGKRTDIRDAHDKYANQEVAYLLQRIEGYGGVVILATNQRGNIDDAFARRFQSIVHFPMPRPEERYQLWLSAFPMQVAISQDIDWGQIASRYELSGAGIINVAQYCSVEALADQTLSLDHKRLHSAILREYVKEGKVV